jgi:hypothetical protein
MEPEDSLLCTQEHAPDSYPENVLNGSCTAKWNTYAQYTFHGSCGFYVIKQKGFLCYIQALTERMPQNCYGMHEEEEKKSNVVPMKGMGGGWMYRSTFLDLGTSWRWVISFTPRPRYPSTHWMDPRAGLDDVDKNSRPYQDSNTDPSVVQPAASRYTDYLRNAFCVHFLTDIHQCDVVWQLHGRAIT